MLLDLKFSIGTLGIGGGAFIAALYGMNLKNFIEESDWGFGSVSLLSFVFAGVICAYGLTKLRRVQRVTMWGGSGASSFSRRGSWRVIDPLPPTSPPPPPRAANVAEDRLRFHDARRKEMSAAASKKTT
jgi:magnesium transporter